MTPEQIAASLTKAQMDAWRNTEWCGDYFLPPQEIYTDRDFRSLCFALRLLIKNIIDDEIEVTARGHEFAAYMQTPKPTLRQRFRNILKGQTDGE